MRFGKAGTRLILNGPGAGLAALLVLLLMASSASALTWEGINQQLERCFALTNETITLVEGVKITEIRDGKSKKKAVATIKKAEKDLGQMIDIYQTLAQADLPPAKVVPSVLRDIKSSISRNLGMARQSLKQTQGLMRLLEKEPLIPVVRPTQLSLHPIAKINATGMQVTLVISIKELRYQTSLLQKRLQTHNLQ